MRFLNIWLMVAILSPISLNASSTFNLGIASPFAVFSGSSVTNTGATNVYGNVGVWPGSAIAGFPPATFSGGTTHSADALAGQAYGAINSAFGAAADTPCGTDLSGQNLGGLTLTAGVYCFGSSAFLGGTLTLDAQGDPNAVFIFQMTRALTTGMDSAVVLTNGGQGSGVIWQVGTSANLGASTAFIGNILALGNITFNTGATIHCGSALAINGAVSLDTNDISICGALEGDPIISVDTPEPSTGVLLMLVGFPCLVLLRRWKPARF